MRKRALTLLKEFIYTYVLNWVIFNDFLFDLVYFKTDTE